MSDEARDAHLQWLDDCARAQVVDYETWLEGRVAQLEAENAALSELLSPLVDVELERDIAMSENQRLTKYVEDYEEENRQLREMPCSHCLNKIAHLETELDEQNTQRRIWKKAYRNTKEENALLEAKLAAIECAGCGKTMLTCACDD